MGTIIPDTITVSKWNQIMEDSFQSPSSYMNAAGIRRTCGTKPTRIRYPKKSNFNSAMDSYLKCTDEVRKMNLSAGLPADTGLSESAPQTAPVSTPPSSSSSTNVPYMEERIDSEGMSMTKKVLIGAGVAVGLTALFFGIRYIKKSGASASPNAG